MREILAIKSDYTTCGLTQTGECLNQLGLPVPLNTCDTHDLAGMHLKRHIFYMSPTIGIQHSEIGYLQHHIACFCRILLNG